MVYTYIPFTNLCWHIRLKYSSGNGAFIRKYSISLYLRFTLSLVPFNPQQDSSISLPLAFADAFPSASLSSIFSLAQSSLFLYPATPSLLHPRTATRTFNDAQLFQLLFIVFHLFFCFYFFCSTFLYLNNSSLIQVSTAPLFIIIINL